MFESSPSCSKVQICFFFMLMADALILKPNVSAVRYLFPQLINPNWILSMSLVPFAVMFAAVGDPGMGSAGALWMMLMGLFV